VGAHPLEDKAVVLNLVDQNPIGFDMAIPSANVVADEFVVPVDCVKQLAGKKRTGDNLKLLKILAAPRASLGC